MQQFNTLVFAFDEESNHLDTFLSVQHSKELINWLAESRKHLITIYVAATRGLRPNEIFALGVNDLQGKRLMIDVNNVVGEPKTEESKAPVPLTIDLRETLESYIQVHGLRGDDFLFASSTGTPMSQRNYVRRQLKTLGKKNRCAGLNFRMLRRTFATHFKKHGDP